VGDEEKFRGQGDQVSTLRDTNTCVHRRGRQNRWEIAKEQSARVGSHDGKSLDAVTMQQANNRRE